MMTRTRKALVEHMEGVAGVAIATFDVMSVLSRIHYFRIHDYVQQLAVVQTLPALLQAHPRIKLVVIDSVAFHFRRDFDDMALRARLLNGMASMLSPASSPAPSLSPLPLLWRGHAFVTSLLQNATSHQLTVKRSYRFCGNRVVRRRSPCCGLQPAISWRWF
jgi:hypothetical protein